MEPTKPINIIPSSSHKYSDSVIYEFVYDSAHFKVEHTNDIASIYLSNRLVGTIQKNHGKAIINFNGSTSAHIITVSLKYRGGLLSLWTDRGISIDIDKIPVKGTLKDPLIRAHNGKLGVWIFFALFLLSSLFMPFRVDLADAANLKATEYFLQSFLIYIIPAITLLFFIIFFNKYMNPAAWLGFIFGAMLTVEHIAGFFMRPYNIISFVIFTALCISALRLLLISIYYSRFIETSSSGINVYATPIKRDRNDPLMLLKKGRIAIWIFFSFFLSRFSTSVFHGLILNMYVYGLFSLLLLFYAIFFEKYFKAAFWVGFILGILETLWYLTTFIINPSFSLIWLIFWTSIRITAVWFLFNAVIRMRSIEAYLCMLNRDSSANISSK